MSKSLLALLFALIALPAFSQVDHIDIKLGTSDTAVIKFLDSLNRLKPNRHFKIKKDVTVDGSLTIEGLFSPDDESYYGCQVVMFIFLRSNGNEICMKQAIIGTSEYAQSNLNFVKDNFKYLAPGIWEKNTDSFLLFKVKATFERKNTQPSTFTLTYELSY